MIPLNHYGATNLERFASNSNWLDMSLAMPPTNDMVVESTSVCGVAIV